MKTAFAFSPVMNELAIASYAIAGVEKILTPALAIYPQIVDANIAATIRLLDGKADRWRPHVKTAKLQFIMQRFVAQGVVNFKCSTALELATVCQVGAKDVLLAYPVVGANALRVREIAATFRQTRVSALVESPAQIDKAAKLAGGVDGVKAVSNKLEVKK